MRLQLLLPPPLLLPPASSSLLVERLILPRRKGRERPTDDKTAPGIQNQICLSPCRERTDQVNATRVRNNRRTGRSTRTGPPCPLPADNHPVAVRSEAKRRYV
jgi:hypothetical protein